MNPFTAFTSKIFGAVAVASLIALAVCWFGWGNAADKRDELAATVDRQAAELALLRTDAELKEIAAGERQADDAIIAQAEKELIDAIQQVPDSQPDAVRVHLGCERLRAAGHLEADLPEPCRLEGAAEARSAP